MLTLDALARSLRKIEVEAAALGANASDEHPIDRHELHLLVVKIGCQAELLEKGLVE